MINKIIVILGSATTLLLSSCTTYYISRESFKNQFAKIDSSKLIEVTVRGPMFETYHYKANPKTSIQCKDKKGNDFELINSPSIEMRVTHGYKNKRSIFYFDRTLIHNNNLVGAQSRFMDLKNKEIEIDSISIIEIQNGQKKFYYE